MTTCPYCSHDTRYPDGGCANPSCTNFRLAVGTEVVVLGTIVRTHDAHGLSYDVRLADGQTLTYVGEADLAPR